LAALARGFSDRYFERGEGPGDEIAMKLENKQTNKQTKFGIWGAI